MSNKILVTDSLFIKDKHVKKLEDAGFEVERLDVPKATEEELIGALKGKVGYIIGGVEKVTDKVFESGADLKAVVFTGTAVYDFVTGHNEATKKGIAIANAPYFNAISVAEFGMSMTLLMCRDLIGLARGGNKSFETTKTLASLKVGILGMGHVGNEYANMAKGMGVDRLYYFNRTQIKDIEEQKGLIYLEKDELFSTCDLIFICVAASAGKKFINEDNINSLKNGSIIISIAKEELIDMEALQKRLGSSELKAAFDEPVHNGSLSSLPLDVLYSPNESSAYNTEQTIEDTSNSAVDSMINILKNGDDNYIVNPEFRKNTKI